ncbi:MAG: PVC-type heme-binding CxxCH protein [Pirellulales bacterium]
MTPLAKLLLVGTLILAHVAGASADDEIIGPNYSDHRQLQVWRDAAGEHPVKSPEDWARRRAHIVLGMQQAMGKLPDRTILPPLDVRVEETFDGPTFNRQKLTFLSEGNDRVPAYLFIPKGLGGKRVPGILALHQTTPLGKKEPAGLGPSENKHYGLELAKRGYVVLVPDYPSFGDYEYDFKADAYTSGSMKGIFNHMRAVDLLVSRPEVDPARIGAIGHSLGGHNAMFVGLFDERIKVIVSSCGWTPFHHYYGGKLDGWTSDRYLPSIRDVYKLDPDKVPFDMYEIVASFAPRAFFSVSPLHDANFDVEGVRKVIAAARPIYELLGVPDNLQVRYPNSEHDFPPKERHESYQFIHRILNHTPREDFAAELPRIAPHEPAEALATFQVLDGFRIEQVAAEPLVASPVAMAFDADNRIYLVEMRDYSEQDTQRLGRVRLIEDADGDGRYDKATVFADHLSWPTAVTCYHGGIFVGAAPDIYYLKDTDGDKRADEKRLIFTGFGRSNVQGLLNSFQWGPDNRIHGSASSSGGRIVRPDVPEFKPVSLSGRDFSFDPHSLELRPESGGAQHGMTFDDWGRKFVCSNSDHIQMVMFEDRYLARNPAASAPAARVSIAADGPQAEVFRTSPIEPWRVVRTRLRVTGEASGPIEGGGRAAGYFTGATGTTIYRGDAWPAQYAGNSFTGDVGSNIVHRKILEHDGVGFIAKRADSGKEFVSSTDNWFRPAQFTNAPDGTLHIIDVYREVIEHPLSLPPQIKKYLDLTSGRDRGRIYRVVPNGFKQRPLPRLAGASTAELVAQLENKNGWHRDTASRLLYERQDRAAISPLEQLSTSSKLPQARMHALYALAGLRKLKPDIVLDRLSDDDPRVREHAVRLSEGIAGDSPSLRAKLVAMAADPDQRVRYQLAFSLGEVNDPERARALAAILKRDADNKWIRLAVLSSLATGAGDVFTALAADKSWRSSEAGREVLYELSRYIGRQDKSQEIADIMPTLELLSADEISLSTAVVRGLGEGLTKGPGTLQAQLAAIGSPKAVQILRDMLKTARTSAADESRRSSERTDAVRLLALDNFADAGSVLSNLISNRQPQDVQAAALVTLSKFSDPTIAETLLAAWPGMSPRLRAEATEVLFSRTERLRALLDAAEKQTVSLADLDPARLTTLEEHPDARIRDRAAGMLSKIKLGKRNDVVEAYRSSLSASGDISRGRQAFQKICAACHRLEGVGHEIGPSLAGFRNRGAEAILVNVLDPNREVNPQYINYVLITRDGLSLTGLIASETANSVTLKRADDATDTVQRGDIDELRASGLSIMPEGMEKQIDPQTMADLLAYLMTSL